MGDMFCKFVKLETIDTCFICNLMFHTVSLKQLFILLPTTILIYNLVCTFSRREMNCIFCRFKFTRNRPKFKSTVMTKYRLFNLILQES